MLEFIFIIISIVQYLIQKLWIILLYQSLSIKYYLDIFFLIRSISWNYFLEPDSRSRPVTVNWYKVCWMAQGFKQRQDIDYKKIYSAVVYSDIFYIMIVIAVKTDIYIYQINVDNIYLNAELEYKLYTKESISFESGKKVYQYLNHILYGLKQSGLKWYKLAKKIIKSYKLI